MVNKKVMDGILEVKSVKKQTLSAVYKDCWCHKTMIKKKHYPAVP